MEGIDELRWLEWEGWVENAQHEVERMKQEVYSEVKEMHNEMSVNGLVCLKVGFHYPSSRAVNSARELGPWTRVVETDLKAVVYTSGVTN